MAETETDPLKPGNLRQNKYSKIARDFDEAVALSDFATLQYYLIQQARKMSWTTATIIESRTKKPVEALAFRFNLSQMAAIREVTREALWRAHRALVSSKVFVRVDGSKDFYRINKDYRQWTNAKGEPLLSAGKIDECRKAADPSLGDVMPLSNDSDHDGCDMIEKSQSHDRKVTPDMIEKSQSDDRKVTVTVTEKSQSDEAPYRNGRVRESIESLERNTYTPGIANVLETEVQPQASATQPQADHSGRRDGVHPRPPVPAGDLSANLPPLALRIRSLIVEAYGHEYLSEAEAYAMDLGRYENSGHAGTAYMIAIRKAIDENVPVRSVGKFVAKVMSGSPKTPAANRPKPAPMPTPATLTEADRKAYQAAFGVPPR